MEKNFDLVVIGTGSAGSRVATKCKEAGWSVAIIDKRPYGGTCALRGCDPKKILRHGAEIIDSARRFSGKGIKYENLSIDWKNLVAFEHSFIDPIPEKSEKKYTQLGVQTFHGIAHFTNENVISVDGNNLTGKNIVIATGSKPRVLPIKGKDYITNSDEFMRLEELPNRILFIGGGYISFEFAHIAARADKKIIMLEMSDRPLTHFDQDIVDILLDKTRKIGINFHTNSQVNAIEKIGNDLKVKANINGQEQDFIVDLVVNGAGRVPEIDELDLEKANVKASNKGIEVNEYLQSTTNPIVYAAGDDNTIGAPLTPIAGLEGRVVSTNILEGNHRKVDYTGIPSMVYTLPALASVGLLEDEAKEKNIDFSVRFNDMSNWFSSFRVQETHAAAKILIDNKSNQIIGAHILGPQSEEMVNLFAFAIQNGIKVDNIKTFISTYPSPFYEINYLL